MAPSKLIPTIDRLAAISRKRYKLKVEADWRIQHFYRFLQVSPSYELARLASLGALNAKTPLPKDFADVEKTYKAFGDVRRTSFWDWWIRRAQFQFRILREPSVSLIMARDTLKQVSDAYIQKGNSALDRYWKVQRIDEGLPASIILAIPISGSRRAILSRLAKIVGQLYQPKTHQSSRTPYSLIRDKTREATLATAMRVLRKRAEFPRAQLYIIGNRSSIQSQYVTDESLKRIGSVRDQRRNMEILTSRHLHRAYLFAENAARGKFPSLDPLPEDPNRPMFNFIKLHSELIALIKWMREEIKETKKLLGKFKQLN